MLRIGDFSRLAQVSIKTLRFYDEIGLFKPSAIDPFTGYRYYMLDQLPRLNRILALKDAGFSLDQIANFLDDDLNADEIRRMLRLKRTELQQELEVAQARLTRLEMRLRQIELEDKMPDYEVVIKQLEPQQALCIRQLVPAAADIRRLLDEVRGAVHQHNIRHTGPWVVLYHHASYRDYDLDVEVAMPVDAATYGGIVLRGGAQMTVRTIPAVDRAVTILFQGDYTALSSVYAALNTYLHEHGYNFLGPAREVFLRGPEDTDNPAEYLTEVQYPVGEFGDQTNIDGMDVPMDWRDNRPQRLQLSRRARTALELAGLEAAALQQAEIGLVHLLLALLRESDSFAGHVLGNFGITIEQVRLLAPRGEGQSHEPALSGAARQVMSLAHDEADQLGHHYIGTEHLLLALAQQQDAAVLHMLSTGGMNPEQVCAAVLQNFK